jgi:hypothetical protein
MRCFKDPHMEVFGLNEFRNYGVKISDRLGMMFVMVSQKLYRMLNVCLHLRV